MGKDWDARWADYQTWYAEQQDDEREHAGDCIPYAVADCPEFGTEVA